MKFYVIDATCNQLECRATPQGGKSSLMTRRFVRLAEANRDIVTLTVDGRKLQALQGDTLLVAILCHVGKLRDSEFGDGSRAGFCLMGACQDCWIWTTDGARLRACTTFVREGMAIATCEPELEAWDPE